MLKDQIDWKLFNDDKLIICLKEEKASIIYNTEITFLQNDEYNNYNYVKNTYTRKTSEYKMIINFNEKTCSFDFGKEGNCKFDVQCSAKTTDDEVVLKYKIDDIEVKIEIKLYDIKL